MGRLPSEFGGLPIKMRIPYTMVGEVTLVTNQSGQQYPDAVFTANTDMPIEIHRVVPRITALDGTGVAVPNQPNEDLLMSLVRARVNDFGKNALMTKNPTRITNLVKGSSERTWEFADPYYLVRSEGFQVVLDALAFPVLWDGAQVPNNAPVTPIVSLVVSWAFQGFLLQVAPASNVR